MLSFPQEAKGCEFIPGGYRSGLIEEDPVKTLPINIKKKSRRPARHMMYILPAQT